MTSRIADIYKNKRVFVTGHTGFKGSWLCLWLRKLGADVTGYSLGPPTNPNLFEAAGLRNKIHHVTGDVRDRKGLKRALRVNQPDIVFHMAAQSILRRSYREPLLTYETNVLGTVNLLEVVRDLKRVAAVIVVTSDKCYENRERGHAYYEMDPMGGYDPYSSSKGCAELVTAAYRNSFFNNADYGKAHNVVLSSARAGNIIGGGDWGEDRLIPDCIRSLTNNKPIIIRNPQAIRPWQYVLDVLFGYLLLAAMMYKKGIKFGGAWNFGPSMASALTVKRITQLAIKHWGEGHYRVVRAKDCHEATFLMLDASKARKALGWATKLDANQGIERAMRWYKNFYAKVNAEEMFEFCLNEITDYEKIIE